MSPKASSPAAMIAAQTVWPHADTAVGCTPVAATPGTRATARRTHRPQQVARTSASGQRSPAPQSDGVSSDASLPVTNPSSVPLSSIFASHAAQYESSSAADPSSDPQMHLRFGGLFLE